MLEIKNLVKSFSGVRVVDEIALTIKAGEFFSLLGPSGCGKTTLLRIIAGLETPTRGLLFLDQREITALAPQERPFNLVFQNYALFPHMNVRDNILFGPRSRGADPRVFGERLEEILELVRMRDFVDRNVKTLSGGQKQRVALARALINQPSMLLLDEPLSALDMKLRQEMQIELRSLQRRLNRAFVLVTHDQEEALRLSDRLAIMNRGRIMQVGTPEEIYERPCCRFVAEFIGTVNSLPIKSLRKDGDAQIAEAASGRRFWIRQREGSPGDFKKPMMFIRPERIQLSKRERSTVKNSVPARISNVLFKGPVTHYVLMLEEESDARFIVEEATVGATVTARSGLGERVFLNWNDGDAFILDAEENAR